jgi:hypothetical protein
MGTAIQAHFLKYAKKSLHGTAEDSRLTSRYEHSRYGWEALKIMIAFSV